MKRKKASRKITFSLLGRKFSLPLFLVVLIPLCFGCYTIYAIDTSLREIGVLPTYTPSPVPTFTPKPSNTPTQSPSNTPRPTKTPLPTKTRTITPEPTATATKIIGPFVIIEQVNYLAEYVDLRNIGSEPQDLSGWKIVSEKGNQICRLAGVINSGSSLRVWTNNPDDEGYNCNYGGNIWNNDELDYGVLYNAQGKEVSRYP